MINSIFDIFGKPKKPLILKNCELFINEQNTILIPIVYIFENHRNYKIYTQGNIHISDIIHGYTGLKGYFEIKNNKDFPKLFQNDNNTYFKIINYNNGKKIYTIENVFIIKSNINKNGIKIKFTAKRLIIKKLSS